MAEKADREKGEPDELVHLKKSNVEQIGIFVVPASAWFLKPEYSSLYITDCTIFSDFTLTDKSQVFLYLYIADNFHLRAI